MPPICEVEMSDITPERRFNVVHSLVSGCAGNGSSGARAGRTPDRVSPPLRGVSGLLRDWSSFHPSHRRIFGHTSLSQQPLCPCTASPEQHFIIHLVPLLVPGRFKSPPLPPPSHGTASSRPAFSI